MSQNSGDPAPNRPPVPPPGGPRKNLESPAGPNWNLVWWYLPLMLLMLWIWQDQWRQMSVKSIPYSEFKEHLARGEVSECEIQDTEITGKIVPKPAGAEAPAAAIAR